MDEDRKPSRRMQDRKLPPPNPWWLKQFQERPIALSGTLASVAGGLILLWFFLTLGGSPDMDLAALGAIPMAIALVGLAIAAAMTSCSFSAGLALRREERSVGGLSTRWTVAFLVLPGLLGAIALVIVATLFPTLKAPSIAYWTPFMAMLLVALGVSALGADASSGMERGPVSTRIERFLDLLGFGSLWVFVAYSAFLTFWLLYQGDKSSPEMFVGLLIWIALCYVLNLMVAWAPKNVFALLAASIGMGLVSLVLLTSNARGFPSAVVSALGMGEMPVSLVVTPKGCEQLNSMVAGRPVCRVGVGEQSVRVCPVMLRSRIGTPFYIGLSAYEADGKWPQANPPKRLQAISIAKSEVLSWSRLEYPAAASSAPVSAGIVTYMDAVDDGKWLRAQCGAAPEAELAASSPKP